MEIAVIHFIILVAISGLTKGAGVLPDAPLNAAVGETVMFTTTLTPSETPFQSVEWKVGGKNITFFNINNFTEPEYEGRITLFTSTGSLELRNLARNDSGEYSVSICFFGGLLKEGITRLNVHVPVSDVMATASSTDLLEDGSVRLSCSSSGSSLSFLWFNGSSEVTASDRVQLTDGGANVTINVTRYDTGPFRCHVSNPVSSAGSGLINLISYGPDNITLTISPSQEYFEEGSNISLMCSADSRPSAVFYWFLNGDRLSDTGPELRLMNIQMNQSGCYSCLAFNNKTLRNETSQPSVVSVLERISGASITSKTNSLIEGNSFNLSCDAAGSVFTREWMKGGLNLTPDDNMALYDNNRVLSFNSLSKKDTGDYLCKVSNPVSHDEATHTMVVFYGPEQIQICGPREIHLEETLTLICFAESVPATYTWKLNGKKIHNSAVFTKNITESSDNGDYICEVMNLLTGRTSSAIHGLSVTDGSGGLSAGAIAGIVIVCLVASSAGAAGGYYLHKKKINKKTPPHSDSKEPEEQDVYENTSEIYENISNQRSSFP